MNFRNLKKTLDRERKKDPSMNTWTVFVNGSEIRAVTDVTAEVTTDSEPVRLLNTSDAEKLDDDRSREAITVKDLIRRLNNEAEILVHDEEPKKIEEIGFDKKEKRVYLRVPDEVLFLALLLEGARKAGLT